MVGVVVSLQHGMCLQLCLLVGLLLLLLLPAAVLVLPDLLPHVLYPGTLPQSMAYAPFYCTTEGASIANTDVYVVQGAPLPSST